MKKKILLGIMLLSFIIIIGCSDKSNVSGASTIDTEGKNGLIKIPLSEITSTLKKYDYDANGVTVTYFVVKASDGEVRTAFDACDVCGGKKGYKQIGRDIKCNNCGRVFSIFGLGTKNKGYGCWPSYLGHEIKDGNVVIKASEIAAGAYRFK